MKDKIIEILKSRGVMPPYSHIALGGDEESYFNSLAEALQKESDTSSETTQIGVSDQDLEDVLNMMTPKLCGDMENGVKETVKVLRELISEFPPPPQEHSTPTFGGDSLPQMAGEKYAIKYLERFWGYIDNCNYEDDANEFDITDFIKAWLLYNPIQPPPISEEKDAQERYDKAKKLLNNSDGTALPLNMVLDAIWIAAFGGCIFCKSGTNQQIGNHYVCEKCRTPIP